MILGLQLVQVAPPSLLTWMLPSSVPTHRGFGVFGRGRNGQNTGVVLGARHVKREAAGFEGLLLVRVVGGQVGGDNGPCAALVGAVVHVLGAIIHSVVIAGVAGNRRIPMPTQPFAVGMDGLDGFGHAREHVHASQRALLGHGIGDAGVAGVGQHVKAVAKVELLPFVVADSRANPRVGGPAPGSVVLHASIDIVGQLVVDANVVELSYGQIFHKAPAITAIPGDVQSAIVAFNDVAGAAWVEPNGVVVRVHLGVGGGDGPGFTAVRAFGHERPKGVQRLIVEGIHKEVRIVEGAVANVLVFADFEPLESAIVGAVQAVLGFVFDERVDFLGVAGGDGDAHSAQVALGQAILAGALGPRFAAVQSHVHAAAFAATFENPRPASVLPHGTDQLVGVDGVHDQVGRAGALVVV